LSVFLCLTLSGKLYTRHFARAIRGEDVVAGLRRLRAHGGGLLVLIWERLNAHRAKVVQQYLASEPALRGAWLPAYAPEVNPEEQVHGNIKSHLRIATPASVVEMRQQVDRGCARLRQRPEMGLNFIRHAGLRVKQLW